MNQLPLIERVPEPRKRSNLNGVRSDDLEFYNRTLQGVVAVLSKAAFMPTELRTVAALDELIARNATSYLESDVIEILADVQSELKRRKESEL